MAEITERFTLRLDPYLREIIRELARNWGCSEAEAVRRCLREEANCAYLCDDRRGRDEVQD